MGGKLTIAPVVTTKFGEKSDLSYVWYKYNEEQSVADTLSFEKNLDVVISDVLPGVKTTLKFKVTDNKTGLYVIEESSFTTIGKYSGGTLMLCKTGGEYDLTMLKKDGTTLYEKIYTQINEGEKLSEQSRKIILINLMPVTRDLIRQSSLLQKIIREAYISIPICLCGRLI